MTYLIHINFRSFLSIIFIFISSAIFPQTEFSLATDLSLLHSFKKEQRFSSVGQSVYGHFHFTPKDGGYISFSYYSPGKFQNHLSATAKSIFTFPQQINFVSDARMRFKQISVGWKRYLKGSSNTDNRWNLYGYAGFGLLFGTVRNKYSRSIDTTLFNLPIRPSNGSGSFKRLTLDVSVGWEIPISFDIYFYTEARAWIPTSDYPSKYLFLNNNAPFSGSINAGLRILFD